MNPAGASSFVTPMRTAGVERGVRLQWKIVDRYAATPLLRGRSRLLQMTA